MRIANWSVLPLLAAISSAQTTLTIACDRDNTLYQSVNGTLSNGSGGYLFLGRDGNNTRKRTLLHFPTTAIPADARLLRVELELNVSRTAAFANLGIDVHRVVADWGEGSSNAAGEEGRGTAATTGDATWLHRRYPNMPWTTVGGDFASPPSASVAVPPFGAALFSSAGMLADVQSWRDTPASNHGWLLKSDEAVAYATRRFESREHAATVWRPVLRVTFVQPGQSAVTGTGCVGAGNQPFTLTIGGAPQSGGSITITHGNGVPGALAANLLALVWDGASLPVWSGCNLLLPPPALVTHNLLNLDGSGGSATNLPIPSGFTGTLLAMQAAALDPGIAAGFVLSNAGVIVVQ